MSFSKSLTAVVELATLKAAAIGLTTTSECALLTAISAQQQCAAALLLCEAGLTEDLLTRTVVNLFSPNEPTQAQPRPEMSTEATAVLEFAAKRAEQAKHPCVTPTHLLHCLLQSAAAKKLLKAAFMSQARRESVVASRVGQAERPASIDDRLNELAYRTERILSGNDIIQDRELRPSLLDQLTVDLTELAKKGLLSPIIGRQKEIRRVIQILGRKNKNNPVLIGEPGVGKTAIAEGLAAEIVAERVSKRLTGKRVLRLDLTSLVSGTSFRGQFEERIKELIDELIGRKDSIVFIDELHTLIGAGAAQGSMDASNALKPALARGEVSVIGATTIDEYRRHIEKDGALTRRFQTVMVVPSTVDETIEILKGLREGLEKHHEIKISDESIDLAAHMSDLYINERVLPDKAIDLIDEAASALAILEPGAELKIEHIQAQISQITGIKLERLSESESIRLSSMENELHKRVIGQKQAVSAVSRAVRRARSGLKDEKRPIGSFLFLGPTGVGKTELSKALAEFMFGDENNIVRLDMSEFMEKHSVSRMIGAPPGYVGYEDAAKLTEGVRRRPYSVVLLDEIEKAHPDVLNVLLQVMDEGRLTDGQGRCVDFKNTIIIMTSNLGAEVISNALSSESSGQDLETETMRIVANYFRPEFINRLDETVCFSPLSREQIRSVLEIQLRGLQRKLFSSKQISIDLDEDALQLLSDEGYVAKFGARQMKRVIQRRLEDPLSDMVISGAIVNGSGVNVKVNDNALVFL